MSEDVLSQAEVESLLSTIEDVSLEPTFVSDEAPAKPLAKVTPYDFKRPERVGKEQMRSLQTMHEGFGRNFGAALSALLRSIVEVKLTSVDQLTYSEFVFSLENPTCFNVIKAAPLEGNLILDINPAILYPIIDRLLGGGRGSGPLARRPLTEIELRLVGRITDLFLDEMRHAWEAVVDLSLKVERVESNPQLVQLVPPNEVVVLVSFELTVSDVRGMMNLCIPFNSIERVSDKLTADNWASYSKKEPSKDSIKKLTRQIGGSVVDLVVDLATTGISTEDLIGLRVGDIITTEHDVHQPLAVSVAGTKSFLAEPGAFKGHKAIQIVNRVQPKDVPSSAQQPDSDA